MLKKEQLQKIASLLKIKEDDLEAAIKDEKEIDLKIDELHSFTMAELTTLKNNEYKNGKEKGVEMAVKDVKEKLSLDFQGKTIDGLIEATTKKALEDAKVEPEKKVKELQEKLATVQNSYKEVERKLLDKESEISSLQINSEVYKHIPTFGENSPALGQDDILQLMKANGYEFKSENGAVIAYRGGMAVQDKLSNPVAIKEVVSSFLIEKKLTAEDKAPSGRGAGMTPATTKFATLSEIKKQYEQAGKSLLGKEFADEVAKAAKDNPEFAMDK
jgi:hypothetical protein